MLVPLRHSNETAGAVSSSTLAAHLWGVGFGSQGAAVPNSLCPPKKLQIRIWQTFNAFCFKNQSTIIRHSVPRQQNRPVSYRDQYFLLKRKMEEVQTKCDLKINWLIFIVWGQLLYWVVCGGGASYCFSSDNLAIVRKAFQLGIAFIASWGISTAGEFAHLAVMCPEFLLT